MMRSLGFERIHVKEIEENVKGMRRFWRYAHEVLTGWAKLDSKTMTREPTHPDLKFTYLIEGQYQAWVPTEHYEKFEAELVSQALKTANDSEAWQAHHDENSHLLAFEYYGVA
jgi:hypothetical protein